MTTSTKTPVQITQELIALHTTRKEVVEKMTAKELSGDLKEKLLSAAKQSDEFISSLMNELSNYGDGVSPMVERDNEYQQTWKNALAKIDTASPDQLQDIFLSLEDLLRKFYETIFSTQADLPQSLEEMLQKQSSML